MALLVTPAENTLDVLEACATKGVRQAIVITSGFGEPGDDEKDAEARMRIYGPNCLGLTNVNARIWLNNSPSFGSYLKGGPIGLVTQGGPYTRRAEGPGRSFHLGTDRGRNHPNNRKEVRQTWI